MVHFLFSFGCVTLRIGIYEWGRIEFGELRNLVLRFIQALSAPSLLGLSSIVSASEYESDAVKSHDFHKTSLFVLFPTL